MAGPRFSPSSVGSSTLGGAVICPDSISTLVGLGFISWGEGGEHGGDWSRSGWKRKASHNRNRMCAPQTSLTGGSTGMEGRAWSGHGGRARPVNQEAIPQHHFGLILGKLDSSLSIQQRGTHVPRNPGVPDCSQTGPAFKALILNKRCFAGQIPQACVGA